MKREQFIEPHGNQRRQPADGGDVDNGKCAQDQQVARPDLGRLAGRATGIEFGSRGVWRMEMVSTRTRTHLR